MKMPIFKWQGPFSAKVRSGRASRPRGADYSKNPPLVQFLTQWSLTNDIIFNIQRSLSISRMQRAWRSIPFMNAISSRWPSERASSGFFTSTNLPMSFLALVLCRAAIDRKKGSMFKRRSTGRAPTPGYGRAVPSLAARSPRSPPT